MPTHTEDEAMPTYTEDEPHRPYLPPYVCTGNVKFRISKTPLWCQKSFFLIQGTLQMTGHSQRRRHSSDDWAHSQRCGYSSTLSSSLVFRPLPLENFWHPVDDGAPGQWCGHSSDQGTLQMTGHRQGRRYSSDDRAHSQRCGYSLKLTQQVPRTKPSRQAPRTKSPRTKPSRQAPRKKSPGTKPSRQVPRTKPSRQAPRTKSLGTKPSRQAPRTKSLGTKPSRQAPRTKSPRTKPSRQAPRTKSSRQAPRSKSPRTKPSRQAPRTKSSQQVPRTKPCRQVPRTNPTDHTSLSMYVWGSLNSGFPKLRYDVKSHFFRFGHSSDDRT